jgi:hypothetical protein
MRSLTDILGVPILDPEEGMYTKHLDLTVESQVRSDPRLFALLYACDSLLHTPNVEHFEKQQSGRHQ